MKMSDLMLVDREKRVLAFFDVDVNRDLATAFAEEALAPSTGGSNKGADSESVVK